jgi:hypothetical protein
LDDEIWDIRLHFSGNDNLERKLGSSDITYLNLLALIETEGYGMNDKMYYVKNKGRGVAGMALLDGMSKVEEMVKQYEMEKTVSITVIRANSELDPKINCPLAEEQIPISDIGNRVVYSVDDEGVLFQSQQSELDSAYLYLCTQQSQNCQDNMQQSEDIIQNLSDTEGFLYGTEAEDEANGDSEGEVELEADSEEEESDADSEEDEQSREDDLQQKLSSLKRKKFEAMRHYEGDAEPEDLFVKSDSEDSDDCIPIGNYKKLPVKKGPTNRSHGCSSSSMKAEFVPSDDNFEGEDSDECVPVLLPSGRKSRAKKMKARMWYDESRIYAEEQLCVKMCFINVYQFRQALKNMHIAQLRNFKFHRNCKDRIIAMCTEQGCPFYMTASQIAGEKTFCIRKMHIEHTCATSGEKCRVNCNWVAKSCEQAFRSDPCTKVETVIDNAKEKYGVEVPKVMAYRARRKALKVVIGDDLRQYKRLRDYLHTVIETNPGTRAIVTTRVLAEHPSPNPRFHGLFIALGGSIEGFTKGCRPFIGKLLYFLFSRFSTYLFASSIVLLLSGLGTNIL